MATLGSSDYAWIVNWIRSKPTHKAVLKASGLSKTQLFAGIQAIETYSVGSYNTTPTTSLRTAINSATGATPTLSENQAMWYAWGAWRGANQ